MTATLTAMFTVSVDGYESISKQAIYEIGINEIGILLPIKFS
jgi:hypothetical protein